MNKKQSSIDGFVPRRVGGQLGAHESLETRSQQLKTAGTLPPAHTPRNRGAHKQSSSSPQVGAVAPERSLMRSDIDDSLRTIDEEASENEVKRGLFRRKVKKSLDPKKPKSKIKRIIKWFFIILGIVVLGVVGWLAFKASQASDRIFNGSVFDLVQNEPLKQDANGRSNFLVFGTANEGHEGTNLTDSIMVISVDQSKKNAYMVSLPRDLWVTYAETCTVGNQGKLNAAYFCGSDDGVNEEAGAEALSAQATNITGLDIQYYAHLNWDALTELVDAVGGVDLTIESSDPRGILDRNFDWACNNQCYYVNYKNGERVHLDGMHALALARSRNASGGYGLPNGNFDREKNQQAIIKALREKTLSAGTLTNIGAVTALLDALGENIQTNVQTKEIRTLMDLAAKIDSDEIVSIGLNDADPMLLTTGMHNGQSIVRPTLGLLDYSSIRTYIKKQISSEPFVKEDATVSVYNGSEMAGIAQELAINLETAGFTTGTIGNAPDGTYAPIEIYQIASDKPATAAKLKELYGVTIKTSSPPVGVGNGSDFVIIIGDATVVQ